MRGLKAALGKDLRLFRSGTGLIALLLPALLLLALRAGMASTPRQAYVEPFPIAVRDEDQTVMSRSLIGQIGRVELFSQVVLALPGQSDADLLRQGAAAVVTIPKDFFYTMYTMDNQAVSVTLNRSMPLEAALFQSVISSVTDIIAADQTAGRAVYEFCYGGLTPERSAQLWRETSQYLFEDALGRQQVFDAAVQTADVQQTLERNFFVCALSALCLFFPLCAVKTLPEELAMGILPRYLAAGGRAAAFFFSKFLTALLLTTPALLLLVAVFQPGDWRGVLLLSFLLFCGAFGLLLCVAAWSPDSAASQRRGNLILLLSLLSGGALYATELLPLPVQTLGRLTLPYYARQGLEALSRREGVFAPCLSVLWPFLALGGGCALLSLPGLVHHGRRRTGGVPALSSAAPEQPGTHPLLPRSGRLFSLAVLKVRSMAGGRLGLLVTLGAAALCGALAAYAVQVRPTALTLAAVVEDAHPLAQELTDRLAAQEGVCLQVVSAGQGRGLLASGGAEGLLTIGPGYGADLEAGRLPTLTYDSAASAASAQAARELIAGQTAAQRVRLRGLRDAEARLNRPLSGQEARTLYDSMTQAQDALPPLCRFTALGGAAPPDPFAPSPLGFTTLAAMFTLLTWAAWTGRTDARRVERRVCALPGGRLLSYGSDVLALLLVGLLISAAAFLPGGPPAPLELAALLLYLCTLSAFALALTRFSALSGRIDALAPFAALITCLAGGCFGDLGQFSPFLRRLALCTPQGLALRLSQGWRPAALILPAAALILLLLGAPPREGTREP